MTKVILILVLVALFAILLVPGSHGDVDALSIFRMPKALVNIRNKRSTQRITLVRARKIKVHKITTKTTTSHGGRSGARRNGGRGDDSREYDD